MSTYRVYYMRPEHFRNFIFGTKPTREQLSETHVFLRNVEATNLDDVFYQGQGEIWSPNGEARPLLEGKGLQHTSMSVGDVIEDPDGKFWAVANFGFHTL